MTYYVRENYKTIFRFLSDIYCKLGNSSLYSNAFYLMLNNAVTCLLGFFFWNVMARYFPAREVGIGSALLSVSNLLGILATLGLRIGLIRFVPEYGEKAGKLINSAFTLVAVTSLLSVLIYLAGITHWSPALGFIREDIWLFTLFAFFTMATCLSGLTDSSLVAGRVSKYVFWKNTLISVLKLPLPVLVFAHLGGFGIFSGTGISTALGVLISWYVFLPRVYKDYYPRPELAKDIMSKMLPYSFANYTANLLSLAPQFIYPLMVLNVLGPEYSAYFYISWMMTTVLSIIPNGIAQSLLAEGSHNQNRLTSDGRRVLVLSLVISIPAVGAMVFVGGWLLHIFGAGYAKNGTEVMRFLSLSIIPQCVNSLYITVNQVRKQIYLVLVQTGFLSVVALGLGYWLLGRIGVSGVGIAYLLAHTTIALAVFVPMLKELKNRAGEPFNPQIQRGDS